MVCIFSTPMMYPMQYAAPEVRYCRRASPCAMMSNPLALLALVLFAPTLLRLAFFVLAPIIYFGAMMSLGCLMTSFVGAALSCGDDDEQARSRSFCSTNMTHCDRVRKCFAKMKEAAGNGENNDGSDQKSAALRRRDLSSVRVEEAIDGVSVIIGAPGVKQEDLEVLQSDHTLHVKGKTTRGTETFFVDRHIVLNRQVALDTAQCVHSNGVLTITLKRKEAKRIAVNAEVAPATVPVSSAEPEESSDDNEWVESTVTAGTKDTE